MTNRFSLLTIALALCLGGGAQTAPGQNAAPDLKITLGTQNTGAGLSVPSAGDGANTPVTVGGESARRVASPASHFMYVAVDWPADAPKPADLYVTVDAFDDGLHELRLFYDKDGADTTPATKYTPSVQVLLMTGTQRWRKVVYHLPGARLVHGENLSSDFRLLGDNVAVHEIKVTTRPPDGFDSTQALDAETLRAIRVNRPQGMEVTFGNETTAAHAAIFKALGATSVENYVEWANAEPNEGQWDWSKWDKQVAFIQGAGLKWTPMLVAGPAYATPLWFQNGSHSHFFRCLEHEEDTRVQSIFSPDMRSYIERFYQAFADHYRDKGVLESVLLAPSGVFGESIYPAGGPGGWTAKLTGTYHVHEGWWAADPYAVAAFRKAMESQYPDIAALNTAWGTNYGSFEEVKPFLPDRAPGPRAREDFVSWYEGAMTQWAAFEAETARRIFPNTQLYLCTGGDGRPTLGADFTAQAAALAPFKVGIRITNASSDYVRNFTHTREVVTATHFYGTFCGFEPAGMLDARGPAACIYNASTSGARAEFFYDHDVLNTLGNLKNYCANATFLAPHYTPPTTAMYLSKESWALDPKEVNAFEQDSAFLRPYADHAYITRRSINDGVLKNYHSLVLADSPVLEPAVATAIEHWVENGGTLVALGRRDAPLGGRLYDNSAWRQRLFPHGADGRVAHVKNGTAVMIDASEPSARVAQEIGTHLHDAAKGGGSASHIVTRTPEGELSYDAAAGKIGGL